MGNAAAKPVHERSYDFRKRAAERPSPPGRPDVVPDSALGIDPKKGGDVVNLRWAPPRNSGGAHITGYLVERRELGPGGVGPGVWVRANAVLARAPRLAVASLEPGRRYQFRVRAENAAGLVSEPGPPSEPLAIGYQGGVATPPRFLTNLSDKLAVEGSRVDFVVDIAGAPSPSVCWYKDSTEIFSTRRTRVATGHGRSSLTFHQVGLADEGEIRCTATNKAGHAVSKAMLRVEAPPHIRLPRSITQEGSGSPGSNTGDDGLLFHLDEVIRLRVGITGRPPPEIIWYHNGEKLTPGQNRGVEIIDSGKHSTLRIPAARRSDRGEYKAKAVNSQGQDSASFLVTVTDRPTPPFNVEAKLIQVGETEIKKNETEEEKDEIRPSARYYIRLSWSPPEDDGGCKISSYIIEYYRVGWNVWLKGSTSRQLSISLDNLISGSEYKFRVKAENPYGMSDPSAESDSIFLPDPKRGLMEAPEQGAEPADSEWLSQQEKLQEEADSKEREEERLRRKRREKAEEEEWRQRLRRRRLDLTPSPSFSPTSSPTWEGNISPRSDYTTDKEGPLLSESSKNGRPRGVEKMSSVGTEGTEFMLVLVPEKDSDLQQEEIEYLEYRRKSTMEEEDEEGEQNGMAPPMSLSAPVISGADGEGAEEEIMPPLRNAVSSTELLHERAMTRIYQAAADEEAAAATTRRGSVGASSMRRGSASSRRDSFKDRENWKELGEKMKEEKAKKSEKREDVIEEKDERNGTREEVVYEIEEEMWEVEEEMEEEEEEEGEEEEEEEEEEGQFEDEEGEIEEEEEDEEEEIRRIEERDRRRAEAIRRQELDMAASEERTGGLSFGVGGRTGRMVIKEQVPPVPPHRGMKSPPKTPESTLERDSRNDKAPSRPTAVNSQQASEDVTYRKVPTTRAPVPALHISTIEDFDDDGKTLDPTAVVIGYYGDLISEISSRARKASPTLYLSREELKAKAEEDFDPFEHGLLETKAEREVEAVSEEARIEEEAAIELVSEGGSLLPLEEPEEIAIPEEKKVMERREEMDVKEEEEAKGMEMVAAPPPPPPRPLTLREIAAAERMRLVIDSFTTVCLLGVASWLLFNGYDWTAAAMVGLIAARELYKAILRRFPFLRRK